MSSLEQDLKRRELQQKKGEVVEALEESGVGFGEQKPTEYEKSASFIVKKNQDPQDLDEQIYQSNIPKSILPNIMMLGGIVNAFDKLTSADTVLIDEKKKKVILYMNSDMQPEPTDKHNEGSGLITYRKMSLKGYRDNLFWKEYWHGMLGTLMEALPAVEGGVRKDGVTMVSSITNSERALLEAQNNQNRNWVSRQLHKVIK